MEKIKGYTLYKKTLADGKSWLYYVQFTDRSGKRMTGKSVQKLRSELGDSETFKITRRAEADSICRRAIEAGFADGRRERTNTSRESWLPKRGVWLCLLPNLDIRGGKSLNTLTVIPVVVGVVGLVIGVVQLVLTVIQRQKDKNIRR